ncbi:MAG TPA: hypothetical protein VIV66_16105 [Pyrinomonadaceae bacterium]
MAEAQANAQGSRSSACCPTRELTYIPVAGKKQTYPLPPVIATTFSANLELLAAARSAIQLETS